jgi:hypothetical protein
MSVVVLCGPPAQNQTENNAQFTLCARAVGRLVPFTLHLLSIYFPTRATVRWRVRVSSPVVLGSEDRISK